MIKRLHIFDFDGTLVDSSHRYRTEKCGTKIDLQHWIDNEFRAMNDELLPLVDLFRKLMQSSEDYVIIATARIWCDLSERFVIENDIKAQIVFARRDRKDNRGGAALKITGVKKILNLKQFRGVEEVHVYEDNLQYLNEIVAAFDGIPHFFPSKQGH